MNINVERTTNAIIRGGDQLYVVGDSMAFPEDVPERIYKAVVKEWEHSEVNGIPHSKCLGTFKALSFDLNVPISPGQGKEGITTTVKTGLTFNEAIAWLEA